MPLKIAPSLLPVQPSLKNLDRSALTLVEFDLALSCSTDALPLTDQGHIAE
jgi:hypothetical protein